MNKAFKVAGVILAVAFIIFADWVTSLPSSTPQKVTVSAVDLVINYEGNASGYLGVPLQSSQSLNSLPGFSANVSSTYAYTITLENYASQSSIAVIQNITIITSGFSFSNNKNEVSAVSGGETIFSATLYLELPSSAYNGTLELQMDVHLKSFS